MPITHWPWSRQVCHLTWANNPCIDPELTTSSSLAGVHIFMAFYGLFVFLETPKDRREGRKIYIIISFLLTVMATSAASLDMFRIFKSLMESTGPLSYIDVSAKYGWAVERWASFSCLAVTIIVGDALLVSTRLILLQSISLKRHRFIDAG